MSQGLLEKANTLKAKAKNTIETLNIFPLWESLGKTYHVGSSKTGLMLKPDIDFETYVQTPQPQDGFKIINEIISSANITHLSFYNFLQTEDPGLYWQLHYKDPEGIEWGIDHWLIPFSHPNAGMAAKCADRISEILTNETRLRILSIKDSANRKDSDTKPRGIDIYKAALRDNIADYDSYLEWQKNNPPPLIETWIP